MTLTFDSKVYSDLLIEHQPRIIKTEEDNEKVLAVVEALLSRSNLTPEEDTLLELLVKLIEDFEEKYYQLNSSTPRSRLLHLLEARNLQQSDLESVLGSRELVAKIVNEECAIAPEQAKILGDFFHVDPSLFLLS
ncbi:MAG: transcriptional regulator [Cyanobacteria bacterium P01_E01_bin.42]